MTDKRITKLLEEVDFYKTINSTQCTTIERLQRENADMQRKIDILKGKAR